MTPQPSTTPPFSELFSLKGQTALVTGGAMGIGLGIVRRLAEAGAQVMIADVDGNTAEKSATALNAEGFKTAAVRVDAAQVSEIQAALNTTHERFGGIDILVNNAGIFPMSPFLETSEQLWDKVIAVNLKGVFFFSQLAAKMMIAAKKPGKIINIASIDGFHPTGNLVHYDASKGGVVMMTKSLALELARHQITVNGIAPGGITTPGTDAISAALLKGSGLSPEAFAEMMKSFSARIPMGRQGNPDEIAGPVLFLASAAARYMTGETIIVDGGYLLG